MKKLEKIDLISQIGRELQSRMSYVDIDSFLSEFNVNIKSKKISGTNSKWVYVKEVLAGEPDELIIKIADELGLKHNYILQSLSVNETDFWLPNHFKLFLSHIASFKEKTHLLKISLLKYGISSFVAHDDIEPTREWQDEIEKALFTLDALAAILLPNFHESKWTDQEIGVAIGRNKLVIPIRKGIDPYGFIGKYQGFNSQGKTIDQVAKGIAEILFSHKLTNSKMIECFSETIINSVNEKDVIQYLEVITELDYIAKDVLEKIVKKYRNSVTINSSPNLRNRFEELFEKYSINYEEELLTESTFDDIPF